jgi:putative ABC transport system permease protein
MVWQDLITNLQNLLMIRNNFILACRNLFRNKSHTLIHILGLSIAMTVGLLILAYVRFEFSYDNFHVHADNTYRIATKVTLQDEVIAEETNTYDGIRNAVQTDLPGVQAATSIYGFDSDQLFIRYEGSDKKIKPLESFKGFNTDAHFFEVFSFPLLHGDPAQVLSREYTAVISETLARRYFDNDALGKVLTTNDGEAQYRYVITGIAKDPPPNAHFAFDLLLRAADPTNLTQKDNTFWTWGGQLYAVLNNQASPGNVATQLNRLAREKNGLKVNRDDYGQVSTFQLQPLRDIHLFSHLQYELDANGSGVWVYALALLALVILALAWVNYINLSTAIAAEKIRAVGIRKVMGASRTSLWIQVFTEAALYNLISIFVAITTVMIVFPYFATFVGMPQGISGWVDGNVVMVLAALAMVSTLVSGGYPAYVIASYYPVRALKGKGGQGSVTLRKFLVVFQFSMALVLTVVTVVANRQLSFMRSRELGINMDQVLIIKALNFDKETWSDSAGGYVVDETYLQKAEAFKQSLRQSALVGNAATLSHLPGQTVNWGTEFKAMAIDPDKAYRLKAVGVDYDFVKTLGLRLLAGRNFSVDIPADRGNEGHRAVLLNEAAAHRLGFKDAASAVHGHIQTYWGADYEVIGVVNSYHQLSLKENLEPLYFILRPRALSYYALQLDPGDMTAAITNVEQVWHRHFPEYPFQYFFLDSFYDKQYQYDTRFSDVMLFFSGLAVFIAGMGLFGLTAFAVVQRTKEIGIRKVLGASALNLIQLVTRNFILLIAIAYATAVPLLYWGIQRWLENYAFRMELKAWFFIAPLASMLLFALTVMSLQVIKVSSRNPVDSLRHE